MPALMTRRARRVANGPLMAADRSPDQPGRCVNPSDAADLPSPGIGRSFDRLLSAGAAKRLSSSATAADTVA